MIFTEFTEFNESWQSTNWNGYQEYATSGNSYILRWSSKNEFFTTMSGLVCIQFG